MPRATSIGLEETATWIRQQELSRPAWIDTPFGRRLVCYADLTATGRHLAAVEDWVRLARPFYANTHTEISTTGRIMTELREAARRIVRDAVHAADDDEIVFCGSGATAAVNKLVGLLGLRIPEPLEREYALSRAIPADRRPVVFVGPYEHHSNQLPWLESIADVEEIDLDGNGAIDLEDLTARLQRYGDRPLKIGSFSAASNVTGIISDVAAIARTLHRADALAFFDYAAAAPYVPIDMHPPNADERIDALFLSPHKFVGGPEASGVLVANRALFRSRTPERPGGGTVAYVASPSREGVDYVHRLAEREEGGTPAILGDVRAGLAFLIKEMAGPAAIQDHEIAIARQAAARLSDHPRIRVLGPQRARRLAIISITVEGLHHDLVSALLDHLFGIQNRAGCSCAGPYGHRLLGIDADRSAALRRLLGEGLNGIKPGWARISLPWYASGEDIDFVLSAVEFVADHGMEFVPLYRFGWRDGVWRHADRPDAGRAPLELSVDALMQASGAAPPDPIAAARRREEHARYLADATETAAALRRRWQESPPEWNPSTGDSELDGLVWFRFVHADPQSPRRSG
ncbi:MAG: aminotransferase class V-fold PLP-dependent enzyme [Acidobacteriota bacterium]|jgi:selenocysteine lyase/cysteine desulfurase